MSADRLRRIIGTVRPFTYNVALLPRFFAGYSDSPDSEGSVSLFNDGCNPRSSAYRRLKPGERFLGIQSSLRQAVRYNHEFNRIMGMLD
jgi:hypothetical protein